MTEAEWLAASDPMPMLDFIEATTSERRARLIACACCRSVGHFLTDNRSRDVIQAAELYVDGRITSDEFSLAALGAGEVFPRDFAAEARAARFAAAAASYMGSPNPLRAVKNTAIEAACAYADKWKDEQARQVDYIRDIFGNPSRPITFSAEWRTSTAVALASQMYEAREFSAMPILADALQGAGCDNVDVLDHCRGPGPHVRGCWVIDLVLGNS